MGIGVAAGCGLAATPATAFVTGAGRQASPPRSPCRHAAEGAGARAGAPASAATLASSLAVGLSAGVVVAGLGSRRARTARRAVENQSQNGPFGELAVAEPRTLELTDKVRAVIKQKGSLDRESYREIFLAPKPDAVFAGGLVGSEYHGWGTYQWDPAGLATRYPEHLPWYREAELKHCRVAMLAWLGLIVPDFVRIPLDDFQDPTLTLENAHNKLIYGLGTGPMWWLLLFCGIIESLRFKQLGLDFGKLTLENAGDVGFGKGFLPKTEEGIVQMKIKELKNGRLAMLAVSGALTQSMAYGVYTFPWTLPSPN